MHVLARGIFFTDNIFLSKTNQLIPLYILVESDIKLKILNIFYQTLKLRK